MYYRVKEMDDRHRQESGGAPGPPAAMAMPLVALDPARAASNTAAVRSASGEALAAMQRGTVVIKTPAVGTLAAGAGALIDHLPDEVLAVVLCSVDAKTLFVAVPSVSLACVHCVGGWGGEDSGEGGSPRKATSGCVEVWRERARWLRGVGG